jgi:hypothetical protein
MDRCRTALALLAPLLVLHFTDAVAVTRVWPGAAPCNGTLQACIDASAPNDVVDVATEAPIDESLNVNKPMVLRAASGYAPRLAAGRAIGGNVNAAGTWTLRVQGFTLTQGFIQLRVSGGVQANVFILDNRVEQTLSGAAQIGLSKDSAVSTTLNYEFQRNRLNYAWSTFDGSLRSAMQVLDGGAGSSTGLIRDNRIVASGSEAHGILISTVDRSHRVAIAGNQVVGGRRGSIYLRQGSVVSPAGGGIDALVTSNLVRGTDWGTRDAYGIRGDLYDGSLTVEAYHNTVLDAQYGVNLFDGGGTTLDGEVRGNVFAYLQFEGLRRTAGSGVLDARNLFFQSDETPSTPGLSPDSIFGDPRFVFAPEDARLRSDSPAVDASSVSALNDRLGAFGVPATDADGLRRIKQQNAAVASTTLDLGAFELGDVSFVHRAPPTSNIATPISDAAINGIVGAYPISTQLWNPDGGAGIYNDQQQSLSYVPELARWVLRQEGLDPLTTGTAFSIFAPGRGDGRFLHLNTAGNTSGSFTALNNPAVNNREDAIVLVTRTIGSGTVVDFDEPLALNYFDGQWSIFRLDGGAMPVNGGFHVYAQPPSFNAFRHVASAATLSGSVTLLRHPLLDGNPCARLHVTPLTDFGAVNVHHIGTYYAGGVFQRWAIFNQDFGTMPEGAQFQIVVDAAASACVREIFRDGFED